MSDLKYIFFSRRGGHTRAMLEGAKNVEGVVIVAHTQAFADELARQCKDARGVGLDQTHRLLGSASPILVDHHALQIMLGERERRIEELERALNRISRD